MTAAATQFPWSTTESLVALHACRSQEDLERAFAAGLAELLPGTSAAFCLNEDARGEYSVRIVLGDDVPLTVHDTVTRDAWNVPIEQRLPFAFRGNTLGELWLSAAPSEKARDVLSETLTHVAAALANLTLNSEARDASTEYCATLQALEEGIVLFQEPDPEAVTARVLALASNMVDAAAGALYVLEEVGNSKSELVLQQALGMPDQLLASFQSADGGKWPDCLMESSAQIVTRADDGTIAGLAADSAPAVLQEVVILPLRYHGVQAGVCVLFNPKDESGHVSESISRLQSFGRLAAALLHRLSLEKTKENSVSIERELQIAETIQKRLVPSEAPPNDAYEFAWHSIAAKSIGGDYVDFLTSDLGDIYAIVADASGHGINSALLMTSFRANYRGNAAWLEPPELAASLNNEIVHEVGPTGMFITAVLMRIEPDTNNLSVSSAGHNPTMVYRAATGTVEQIESHGPPLGFMGGVDYEGYESDVRSGDVLLLYTDGITEATDQDLEMFGEERLEALLCKHAKDGTAQEVLDATLKELADFTGCEQHEDDVSLMVVKAR